MTNYENGCYVRELTLASICRPQATITARMAREDDAVGCRKGDTEARMGPDRISHCVRGGLSYEV